MKVLAIIPAYNEAGNIERVVREVLGSKLDVEPLVIDDGSRDATADIARRSGARVISLPFNLGIGGAVQTGYRYALENGFDAAVQIDGDGQHDLAYLAKILTPLSEGRADMVVGSRFLEERGGFLSTPLRRMGIKFFTALIRLCTGLTATDPTSGFRICNRKLIKIYAGYYPGDFPEPEALVVARRLGARVLDVSVEMRSRHAGVSSIGGLKSSYYMVKVTSAILLHLLKDRKVYGVWE